MELGEQPEPSVPGRVGDFATRVRREHRVERAGRYRTALELVDLILHQRDERRDDERRAWEEKRRQLIAERFS